MSPSTFRRRLVLGVQTTMLLAFLGFAGSVMAWVVHLVRLSIELRDVPNASMAISLVAIPIFAVLTGIVIYLFVGMVLDPESRSAERRVGEG